MTGVPDIHSPTSRRRFLLASGAAGSVLVAGCLGNGNGTSGSSGSSDGGKQVGPLTAGGSSTVYPITSNGASVWNSNPKPDDKEYWGPSQYGIKTDKPVADYWAGLYGFSSEDSAPPFQITVGLSHSGTGVEKVMKGQIDIGDSSAPVASELPDLSQKKLDKFVDHVVGVDGQPIVVSREIYDAGVKQLTEDELKKIYKGEIKSWSQIKGYSGPDKKIQVIGRTQGSGTDTAFRSNLFGNAKAAIPGVDIRKGQNQQVKTLVTNTDNAIAYLALAFVEQEGKVPPIGLKLDGTVYKYGKNLGAKEYPLSRDLHCYTYDGTSKKEAAFIRMLLHDYGQKKFVEPNNYFTLPADRQKKQLQKLPKPEK